MKYLLSATFAFFSASICFGAPPPPVTALAYHPSGKLLLAGTYAEIVVIDPWKAEVVGKIPSQTGRVTALAFNKTGERLAVASGEPGKSGQVRLYDFVGGAAKVQVAKLDAHADSIYSLTFSPDGKLLASAGYDRIIKLWNAGNLADPKLLQDHSDTIYGLSFHPDGKLLASAAADRAVKVWDLETGKRLYTLSDPTDWVYAVAWSPDGQHLAAAGIDKSIRVWAANADGAKLVHSVFAHTQPVTRLVYANDGKSLYSISEGKSVKGWDAATMKEKAVFPSQADTLLSVALHPSQKQLAVGRFDGALVLLDAENGKPVGQPLPAKPKPPAIQKLVPSAVLRGKTTRITIEGTNLGDIQEVMSDSRLGTTIKIVAEGRTPTRFQADVAIPAAAPAGVINLKAKSPAGDSAGLPLIVDRYPAVNEAGASDSSRRGLKVNLPATLVGVIHKAGDADYFRFDVKPGQEVAAQALTAAVGSRLEPILELADEEGKTVAESANGLLGYVARRAGTLSLGIRDKDFRGAADFNYRLSVGGFPLVAGIVPLSLERGKNQDIELLGVNLGPHKRFPFTLPADAAPGAKISVPLPKLSESVVGTAQIVAGEFPENRVVRQAAEIPAPGTATGVIEAADERHSVRFRAKKGERLVVEVEARRLGSPLDSVIEIVDARGLPVMQATLRCVARTFSTFRDNDSAASGIRLESWNELAMDDYIYVGGELMRIRELPKNPDDDCQFYAEAGQRLGYLGTTPTHHSNGSSLYKVEIHPPGATFPANGHPVFHLAYRNDDGGPGYGKDSRLFFDVPADGEYRAVIGDSRGLGGSHYAYRLTVRLPRPDFSVAFTPTAPAVWKGGSIPINVNVKRLDGYDGPISLKLENLPSGFEAPPSAIEAGQNSTTFALYASPAAALSEKPSPLKIVARASINGKEIIRDAIGSNPQLVEPGDIVATTAGAEVVVHPGRQTKLLVSVERRNGFAGRVPLEVRGLPHGVRVLDIGLNGILVTPGNSQREIAIYAEPWVKPMEHPFIVLARREGKNTEHGARSVLLKVVK